MIGAVEVEIVDAGRRPIEVEVAAAGIRLGSVREIVKRHEQAPQLGVGGLGKCRQLERLSLQRELERADPLHLSALPGRRLHLEDVVSPRRP